MIPQEGMSTARKGGGERRKADRKVREGRRGYAWEVDGEGRAGEDFAYEMTDCNA